MEPMIANKCIWLPKGQTKLCGEISYKNDLCYRHYFWSDKRKRKTKPCKKCGKGVLVEYQLCSDCGGRKIYYRNICIKQKAKENHSRMIQELKLVYYFSQKKLFI